MDKLIKLRKSDYKSYPLTSYDQIINFKPSPNEQSLINEYCVEISSKYTIPGPKTLLCHDHKGGYLDDASCKGSQSKHEFRFHHWHLIDTFVYFAHHLVTIPPMSWIQAAHLNGVEILGTIITEHETGAQFLESILCDDEKITGLSKSLANIMTVFKFDGWLLNIENKVSHVPKLVQLVKSIGDECKKVNADSKLIWYDSVTIDGELRWQNELNVKNEIFFDHCDGILLNYGWRTGQLVNSLKLASRNRRINDVYVGVDVFGRGCFGGGGFNTNIATDFIRKFKLSIALFAPGWIHEANDSKKFNENNIKFWNLLNLPTRHLPNKLPIETSFCQGVGNNFFEFGQCVDCSEWTNHLMQQPQFAFDHAEVDFSDSFIGGSCLRFRELNRPLIELKCEWTKSVRVIIVYKTDDRTFDDSKLIVLAHSRNCVVLGRKTEESYDSMINFRGENIEERWRLFGTCLSAPARQSDSTDDHQNNYLEKIYLHVDLKDDEKIDLKLGYLGIF